MKAILEKIKQGIKLTECERALWQLYGERFIDTADEFKRIGDKTE